MVKTICKIKPRCKFNPIFKFIFEVSLFLIFAVPILVFITYFFVKNGFTFKNLLRRTTDWIMPLEIVENDDDNPPSPPKNNGNNILSFPESKQSPNNILFFPKQKQK